jgi:hypothetical protein
VAFHISPASGEPRPCKAATPDSCPVGGEHFTDQKEAQSFAEDKLANEYEAAATHSRKVDLSQLESMKKQPDGRYAIEPGEYYVICSESIELPEGLEPIPADISKAIFDPSLGTDNRANTMIGGYIGKEPIYTIVEKWSGVANSFVTPKLYDAMTKRGLKLVPDGEKPPVLEITKPTTLGGMVVDDSSEDEEYGFLEIGDKKVDFINGEDSIALAERTVI